MTTLLILLLFSFTPFLVSHLIHRNGFEGSKLTVQGSGGLLGFVIGYHRFCFCRCGVAQSKINIRTGRLKGGESITPHQFPWLVGVNTGSQTVGGSLISNKHVLTAASPFYGIPLSRVSVTLGAHDRCGVGGDPSLNSSVASVVIHPGYSPTNGDNDIALVKLRHGVTFSSLISPICMPLFDSQEFGQVAWTASWEDDSLKSTCTPRVASLPILSKNSCLKGVQEPKLFSPDKGCLGPLGSKSIICKTDVGAPVMTRWTSNGVYRLAGVISQASSCDTTGAPLYTKVIDHAAWIYDHIRQDCQCF